MDWAMARAMKELHLRHHPVMNVRIPYRIGNVAEMQPGFCSTYGEQGVCERKKCLGYGVGSDRPGLFRGQLVRVGRERLGTIQSRKLITQTEREPILECDYRSWPRAIKPMPTHALRNSWSIRHIFRISMIALLVA